jgi:hypothetical protein
VFHYNREPLRKPPWYDISPIETNLAGGKECFQKSRYATGQQNHVISLALFNRDVGMGRSCEPGDGSR